MSKYIDSEKLKAEINRRMNENCELAEKAPMFSHRAVEDYGILAFIEALQQERQEQPEFPSNLDEAAENSWAVYEYRESPRGLYSTCYLDGFKDGAEWMAGQINKETEL